MKVTITRSKRRKRTISAKLIENGLHVYLPAGLSREEEKKWVDKMLGRVEKRKRRRELNVDKLLSRRAQELNDKYFKGQLKIASIEYVTNQTFKFEVFVIHRESIELVFYSIGNFSVS